MGNMTLMLDSPQMQTYAPKKLPAYRVEMERARAEYEPMISNLSAPLQGRLQRYFDALEGKYTYHDKKKKKNVTARTYKKRIEFAKRELERIDAHIQISRRYGKMDDITASQISAFTRNVYQEAIGKNKYAKSHNVTRTGNARTLKSNISELENKVTYEDPLPQIGKIPSKYYISFGPDADFRRGILEGLRHLSLVPTNYQLAPRVSNEPPIYPKQDFNRLEAIPYEREKKRSGLKKWLGLAACGIGLLGGAAYGFKTYVDNSLRDLATSSSLSEYFPAVTSMWIDK